MTKMIWGLSALAFASVLMAEEIEPIYEGKKPVEVCREVQKNSGGRRILGAVVGGVVGHQFGKGSGKTAATVAGAAVGARAARRRAQNNPEVECHIEYR
jgi:uncharacterized protein YcfJ